MRNRILIALTLLASLSCQQEPNQTPEKQPSEDFATFEKEKWQVQKGEDYPYRKEMLNDLLESDTIKQLSKEEIYSLLGEPSRTDSLYLFYRVEQKRIGFWPLHTTTLVIKMAGEDEVEWVRLHE